MPAPTEFTVDAILNRCFRAANNALAGDGTLGDNRPPDVRSAQEIFNAVYDSTLLLLQMN